MEVDTLGGIFVNFFRVGHALLQNLDSETAHRLLLVGMQNGIYPRSPADRHESLRSSLWGLSFPNPIGMAAGFDKDALVPQPLLATGFGFVEVGTLTPRFQSGNPKPRLFRLSRDEAVINRMGFCNQGYDKALERLRAGERTGIIGVNVGPNKESPCYLQDYVQGIGRFADVAKYFTINVSSPNTPGLRNLQERGALKELLSAVLEARDTAAQARPILLKISPDLDQKSLMDIVEVGMQCGIDGLVISNTTVSRPSSLQETALAKEKGGLSGKPLFALSTPLLAQAYLMTEGRLPIIGVGGISDAETAYQKIRAGASLLQLYSALVYHGPGLLDSIQEGLVVRLRKEGFRNLQEAVGTGAQEWSRKVVH